MKKTLFLASLAVVSFSVLGMENVPNFGNDPLHCPEQNRVNVSETNLQNSNIDFSLLNDIDHNIANDSNQPLPTVLNSSNPATEKQETSASQNTDRKGKRRAEESEDVQESAKKIRRDDQSFLDPNVATSSQSAVTEETSSLSSSQEMDNQ
ncbi:MAG: hypothetical protein K5780_03325, partial [Alphaproteobacteria bacterium]|nr:hypothetical protein [Alphaproteobacteria bacterium]